MLTAIDLKGQSHVIEGTTTLEEQLSSDDKLSVKIPWSENNSKFINEISVNWRIEGVKGYEDTTQYVVKYVNKKTVSKKPYIELKCIIHALEVMNTRRYYGYHEKGYSLAEVMTTIFKDIPFNYRIVSKYDTKIKMDAFGDGQSRLEIFSAAIELWQMEFVINGDTIEIYQHVVRKPDYILRDDINAQNINIEEDGSEFYTYVRAYGDINDGEPLSMAGVSTTYRHPLADSGLIGIKEAPPIKLINNDETSNDKNVIKQELEQAAKDLVDNSLKVSITTDFLRLSDYPEANPRIADEITLQATNLNYEFIVRLIAITTDRDASGKVIKQSVTFGDRPIQKRHQSNVQYAAQFISDLQKGKKQLSKTMLDSAMQVATQLLMNVRTELDFTETEGLVAVNRDDPEERVIFNSRGLWIEKNGVAQLAINGSGIVADTITTGTLNTKEVTISGTTGVFIMTGDTARWTDPKNSKKFVEIKPGNMLVSGGGLTVIRPDGAKSITNGLVDTEYSVYPYQPEFMTQKNGINAFYVTGGYYRLAKNMSDSIGDYANINAYRFKHNARYLKIGVAISTKYGAGGFVKIEEFSTSGGTYFNTVSKGWTVGAEDTDYDFVIDLGPPTKKERKFYIKAKTNNEGTSSDEFGLRFYKIALDD